MMYTVGSSGGGGGGGGGGSAYPPPPDSSRSGVSTARGCSHEISALRSGAVDASRVLVDVSTIHDIPTLQKMLVDAQGVIVALDAWYSAQLTEKERVLHHRMDQLMMSMSLADDVAPLWSARSGQGGVGSSSFAGDGSTAVRTVRRAGSPSVSNAAARNHPAAGRTQSPLKAHVPFGSGSAVSGRPSTAALTARTSSSQRLEMLATPTRRVSPSRPATARSPGKSPMVPPLHSRPPFGSNSIPAATVSRKPSSASAVGGVVHYVGPTSSGPNMSPRSARAASSTVGSAYNTPLSTPRRQKQDTPITPGRGGHNDLTATGRTIPGGAPPSSNLRHIVNWSSSIPYVPPSSALPSSSVVAATPAHYERPPAGTPQRSSYAQANFSSHPAVVSRGYNSATLVTGTGTAVRTTFSMPTTDLHHHPPSGGDGNEEE